MAYPDAEIADIACVTSALSIAATWAHPPYEVVLASIDGEVVRCSNGLELVAQAALPDVERCDTIIVAGGSGHEDASNDAGLVEQVRRLAKTARRVVSVCTGATVLAAAGLLDGRRATTHWNYAAGLADRFPKVLVDAGPIYIKDGPVATSGGLMASLDLTLALIEDDHGAETARLVAKAMVTYLQRPGSQPQVSMFTASPRQGDHLMRQLIDHILANPGGDLRPAALAARANVSQRQLTRVFREHLGQPPAMAVRNVRLELAVRMLRSTDRDIGQIADRCGFSGVEHMRQAFVSRFGMSPRQYRLEGPGSQPTDGSEHTPVAG